MTTRRSANAYAIIHFGDNPKYLELELFFIIMLKTYTTYDIVYMYSSADTPKAFVSAVRALGGIRTRAFNDSGVTFAVSFPSVYTNFNMLRTCDFIFAYLLTQYKKVCIIESDMVVLRNIDDIFTMKTPAIVVYDRQHPGWANTHYHVSAGTSANVLKDCGEGSGMNGGMIVIEPSRAMFAKYVAALPAIVAAKCKYPNESLFKYVNGSTDTPMYNLPVKYNTSHYHLKRLVGPGAAKAPLRLSDVAVVHFNETPYKHLDIIKSPVGDDGTDWLAAILRPEGHHPKRLAIEYYYRSVYLPNVELVERLMRGAKGSPQGRRTPRKRCSNGTRKNRKTGECIHKVAT
jgi:hypothetical protein